MNAIQTVKEDQSAVSPLNEGAVLMQLITELVRDKDMDLERFRQIVKLRDEFKAQEAKKLYDIDFVQMKPHLPKIIRRKDNAQTRSKYAPLEDINTEIDPILSQYGFGTASKIIAQTDVDVTLLLQIKHRGGYTEEMPLTMPLDDRGIAGTVNKTKPHALSSAIMYCRRVGFSTMLNISTGDDRDGNQDSGFITIEQAADFDNRARALGEKNHANLLAFMKVEKATDIPAKALKKAMNALTELEAGAAKLRAEKRGQ